MCFTFTDVFTWSMILFSLAYCDVPSIIFFVANSFCRGRLITMKIVKYKFSMSIRCGKMTRLVVKSADMLVTHDPRLECFFRYQLLKRKCMLIYILKVD